MRDFAASTTATDVAPNVSPTWEAYSAETVTLFNADAGAVCFCRMALAAPPVGARGVRVAPGESFTGTPSEAERLWAWTGEGTCSCLITEGRQ